MRFFAAAIVFFGAAASYAQAPEVPNKIQFAGMTLTIRDDAQREIQKDVDALTQHGRYYQLKVERAKTYFPIIEKILEEEHVPDDFKYLVLQESALVPDAVSVSNAVGFWQFKDFTALEMGLRVDKEVDERMNLVSATRGAARYLKQSNFYFNNWLYALQSYQMGAGGVKRAVGDQQNGAKNMDISSETYWYVKKFLAHKVAFEHMERGEAQTRVVIYQTSSPKSLKEIAEEVSSEESVLREYNKWLKAERVPDDKSYTVLVPVGKLDSDFSKLVLSSTRASRAVPLTAAPERENEKVNGILSIRARAGETVSVLADRGQVSISSFLKYNDISIDHTVEPGKLYLLGKKKNKGNEAYGKVKPGDDIWSVSQRYGVKIRKLMKYNRLNENQRIVAGSTLWLSSVRPREEPIRVNPNGRSGALSDVARLDENQTFDWNAKPPKADAVQVLDSKEKTAQNIQKSIQMPTVNKEYLQKTDSVHTEATFHEVKSSDTLYSIARQFGVTIKDLMEWNGKKDLTVTVGEKLRIIQK